MPSVCESNGISLIYDVTATREKGRHLAVSCVVRVPIEGLTDQEQRSRVWVRLPTCPKSIALAEAFAETKHLHQCPVEGQGPIEILHAYKDVGEHASDPYQLSTALGPGIHIASLSDRPPVNWAECRYDRSQACSAAHGLACTTPRVCCVGFPVCETRGQATYADSRRYVPRAPHACWTRNNPRTLSVFFR